MLDYDVCRDEELSKKYADWRSAFVRQKVIAVGVTIHYSRYITFLQ